MAAAPKPLVLVFSLSGENMDGFYAPFMAHLKAQCEVEVVKSQNHALRTLSRSPRPQAVLLADEVVTERRQEGLLRKLAEYTRSGGTIVFGCRFSTFVEKKKMEAMFQGVLGLPWTRGDYYRCVFSLNRRVENIGLESLASSYSMKASQLRNVTPTAAVYVPTETSRIQSFVFAPTPVGNLEQTPAAFTRLGQGYVGYVGDVNAEEETTHLLIAMLLASSQERETNDPATSTNPRNMQRPSVLVLMLQEQMDFAWREMYADVLAALRNRANVTEASTIHQALRRLTTKPLPNVVLEMDGSILEERHSALLSALIAYSQLPGNTVVFACQFAGFVTPDDFDALFERLDLSWRWGTYTKKDVTVTKSVDDVDFDSLTETYEYNKALYLRDVPWDEAVYVPTLRYRSDETSAALAKTTRGGRIGYVGDINTSEHLTKLLLALCFPKTVQPSSESAQAALQTVPATQPARSEGADNREPKPEVLLISFDKLSFFDSSEQQLLSALHKNAVVQEALDEKAALKHLLTKPSPAAVLLTHTAVAHNDKVIHHVIAYARAGGKVIVGFQFPNSLPLNEFKPFFEKWELPWAAGAYHRTTCALNTDGVPAPLRSSKLFPAYSMKAGHLKHVKKKHRVYMPTTASCIEEQFSQPGPLVTGSLLDECAAAWAPIGKGYLGYVGDVNTEEESIRLVLEMCGITIKPGDLGPRKCSVGMRIEPGGGRTPITETYGERLLPVRKELSRPRPREQEAAARSVKRANMSRRRRLTAEVLKEEGNTLFKEGKSAEAASKYRQAALVYGPRPVYMSNLAAALLKMGRHAEAESAASRALFYEPKNIKARYRRGMASKGLKSYALAIEDFRSVLRQDPSSHVVRSALEETLLLNHGRVPPEGDPKRSEEHDPLWEIMTESDSSEYEHDGNGTPCRYLNHDGCRHGSKCRWKHAPDTRSVRDEIGRNVCMMWLLGHCTYNKCYYAHDKTYLSAGGWWNKPNVVTELWNDADDVIITGHKKTDRAMFLATIWTLQIWRTDGWTLGRFSALDDEKITIGKRSGVLSVNTTQRDGQFQYSYSMPEETTASVARGGDEDDDGDDEDKDYDGSEWDDEEQEQRMDNMGFTNDELNDILSYGVKPWDDDAWDVLDAVRGM